MNEICVIDKKKTYTKNSNQKIIVYLDSLLSPLDNIGYLVSPSIIKIRPFPNAPRIEVAYLRTTLHEVWFPYLPFYRFSPQRDALVIKAERLLPHHASVNHFGDLLDDIYSEKYLIEIPPNQIPDNMIFCKCTNPPEEEHAILERKEFAEQILHRFFKVSDSTADKLNSIMRILDDYLEAFHTANIPIFYYNLAGAAGDFELLTALISAVASVPEALGLETLATKGDIIRATTALRERTKRLSQVIPQGENKDAVIRSLQSELNQYKRLFQHLQQAQQTGGEQRGSTG